MPLGVFNLPAQIRQLETISTRNTFNKNVDVRSNIIMQKIIQFKVQYLHEVYLAPLTLRFMILHDQILAGVRRDFIFL